MSERIADRRKMMMDEPEGTVHSTQFSHPLPESDEDEDYIDTGAAILNFYCTLVDLLGRCAPDASVIALVRKILLFIYFNFKIGNGDSCKISTPLDNAFIV